MTQRDKVEWARETRAAVAAGLAIVQSQAEEIERLREAMTDIRNRILCPVGPAPTLDKIGEIAGTTLAGDT